MNKTKFLGLLAVMLLPTTLSAQQRVESTVEADIVSQYMWRGSELGGVSIQPTAEVKWQGLSLSAFGSVGLDKEDTKEIDLTLGYSRWGFNVGVTDYWFSGIDEKNRYLHFEKKGAHQVEANLGWTCKYGSIQAYTMVWGNDYKISGEQAYSTYIELTVPFTLGSVDWTLKAGVTPFESAGYTTPKTVQTVWGAATVLEPHHFYAEGFACNLASLRATKSVRIGNLEIPLYGELHYNPYLNNMNMFFGMTLCPF